LTPIDIAVLVAIGLLAGFSNAVVGGGTLFTFPAILAVGLSPVIANATARRLSCDPIVECTIYDHKKVLGIGRRSRLIPAWLRHQLWHRDGSCRFPGCGPETGFMPITSDTGPTVGRPIWTI